MLVRHLGIAVALVLLAAACGDDATDAGPRSYGGEDAGFSFSYPGDWERIEGVELATEVGETDTIELVAVGRIDRSSGNLVGATVQVDDLGIEIPAGEALLFLTQEFDPIMESLALAAGGSLVSVETVSVAGRDARAYVIDSPVRGQDLRSRTTAFVVGDRLFKILCQAPAAEFDATAAGCDTISATLMVIGG